MRRRLYICIPMFLVAISLLLYSLRDKDGFDMIWRYFAWANQTLSVFTLWAITVYLVREKKGRYYYVTYFPALFMTAVYCTTYICIAPEGFGLGPNYALGIALIAVVLAAIWFNIWYFKTTKNFGNEENQEIYRAHVGPAYLRFCYCRLFPSPQYGNQRY